MLFEKFLNNIFIKLWFNACDKTISMKMKCENSIGYMQN